MHNPALRIHLWTFNVGIQFVSDQILFFLQTFRQQGYVVTVGKRPRPDALNFVLENITEDALITIKNFCTRYQKKIGIIMTEHIDFERQRFIFHGTPCGVGTDYMSGVDQYRRLNNLLKCHAFLRGLFVLGDLPKLKSWDSVLPGIPVHHIPFPVIQPQDARSQNEGDDTPVFDFVFTGKLTGSRVDVIRALKKNYHVHTLEHFVSRCRRDQLNQQAKIVLNLPQNDAWQWLSPMRVMAALQMRRATLSIGTSDVSAISACCRQVPFDACISDTLDAMLHRWQEEAASSLHHYHTMQSDFLAAHPFPKPLFDYWALLESLDGNAARRA